MLMSYFTSWDVIYIINIGYIHSTDANKSIKTIEFSIELIDILIELIEMFWSIGYNLGIDPYRKRDRDFVCIDQLVSTVSVLK